MVFSLALFLVFPALHSLSILLVNEHSFLISFHCTIKLIEGDKRRGGEEGGGMQQKARDGGRG